MEETFDTLWPLHRSITGEGIRRSLDIVDEIAPLERMVFKTGETVFDWTVPYEWTVREAHFIDPNGVRHCDVSTNNLHLVGYSVPFRGTVTREELSRHLYSLPDRPDAIPYVTAYYQRRWGFCLSHRELESLPDGDYEVVIDTTLRPGRLEIGEAVLPGTSKREILFSSYLCHPSMANNELSGPLAVAFLYDHLKDRQLRYTCRFVFSAETIGTLCYLRERGQDLRRNLAAGYVCSCLGDSGPLTYKRSRRQNTLADRAALVVLQGFRSNPPLDFDPGNGSDERQYGSPGFDLPVGSVMRTMYGTYPEYHSSDDNKGFIDFSALAESHDALLCIAMTLEQNIHWVNRHPYGEPQLGRRGIYPNVNKKQLLGDPVKAMLWILNLGDGHHDLISIAERSGQSPRLLHEMALRLEQEGIIERATQRAKDLAVGVDIVDTHAFASVVDDAAFLARVYAPEEVKDCYDRVDPARHLAVRFAAKEATVKALHDLGLRSPPPIDLKVARSAGGAPAMVLPPELHLHASLSLSHTDDVAIAVVILRTGAESK